MFDQIAAPGREYRISHLWQKLLRRVHWITHPITVFVALQVVWLAITLIWVIWFVDQQEEISRLADRFGREHFDSATALAILIVGCILLGVLLVGTIALFVFGQRQSSLARQQRSFVSSVTHELKSPLASLQLGFETLKAHRKQMDEPTAERMVDMMLSDIERLRRLVDQILVAGRLDRGVMIPENEHTPVNIPDLVREVVDNCSYLDSDLRNRVTVACPENLRINGPDSAFSLILTNLIENAVKYSPTGTPITVAVGENNGRVVISVTDEGHGLDKKDRRRVFRMFHRSESAVTKAIPGTGLGLYIVNSAVRVLGGRVWAESDGRGQGTTFYVSLPTVPVSTPKEAAQ